MSSHISFEQLLELVGGDEELIAALIEHEIIEITEQGVGIRDVDRVLVSRTLVRELEVNWAGVDIILRLRQELAVLRTQLHRASGDPADDEP